MLYGIDVHLYSPGKMFTPGYDKEAQTKPSITAKIEESDPGITPDVAARGMLKGATVRALHAALVTDRSGKASRTGRRTSRQT
jgi:3-dehydrosphinganine reductase